LREWDARVVPFVTEVLPDFKGYRLNVFAPLIDFPSGSDTNDACRMNAFLEALLQMTINWLRVSTLIS
jgi:lauroyl/myristoyl acyltransferase